MNYPRMSFHVGDYKKHTGHLRAAEHGAYFLLILHYWVTGGLPVDDRQLASIACMTVGEWRKHKPTIKSLFKDDWRLEWLDAALSDALAYRERRSKAGKKGNQKRWAGDRHAHADRNAFGNGSQCDPSAIVSGSLPPASPHGKEPQQGGTYPNDGEVVMEGQAVVPFMRGRP